MIEALKSESLFDESNLLPVSTSDWSGRRLFWIIFKLRHVANQKPPRLVISQGPLLFVLAFIAFPFARHAIHVHNSYYYDKPLVRFLFCASLVLADEIWFVSPKLATAYPSFLRKVIACKQSFILPPIWSRKSTEFSSPRDLFSNNVPTILISTRYHPSKRIDEFLQWITSASVVSCKYAILTDADLIEIHPPIRFSSSLSVHRFSSNLFYSVAQESCFVASLSDQEGFCISLLEGMQHGLVPLATYGSLGPEYIIKSSPRKLLFDKLDFSALDILAAMLYSDRKAYRSLSAWAKARESFLRKEIINLWSEKLNK